MKSEKKKKNIKKNRYKTFLIIFLSFVFLVFLFVLLANYKITNSVKPPVVNSNTYDFYNGFVFVEHPQIKNVWSTTIKIGSVEQVMEFRYHPLDLENYSFNSDINQYVFISQALDSDFFISFTPEALNSGSGHVSLTGYELARVFRTVLGFNVFIGVTESVDNLDDYEVISCENASNETLVLEIDKGDTGFVSEGYCIRLFFDEPEDSLKMASLLIYKLLGIME